MIQDLMKDYFRLLREATKAVGLPDCEWSIVCRTSELPTGLYFCCIGYIHFPNGAVRHIMGSGPDMATAIQRAQGELSSLAGAGNVEA